VYLGEKRVLQNCYKGVTMMLQGQEYQRHTHITIFWFFVPRRVVLCHTMWCEMDGPTAELSYGRVLDAPLTACEGLIQLLGRMIVSV
jgi:hypothetical protein